MLVAVDDDVGFAALPGNSHRDQLVGESARVVGGDRALMGPNRQLVLFLARDPVLATQVLRGLDHSAFDGVRSTACGLAGTVESIRKGDATLAHAGAKAERVVLHVGHRLRPARHDYARRACGDLARGVEHRLQAGAAPSVDLQSRHTGSQSGVQCGDAANRGCFAIGIAVTEHHVVDVTFAEAGLLDERAQCRGGQVGGRQRRQCSAHTSNRGAQRIADNDVGHVSTVRRADDILKYLDWRD